jgi:hypothetical protein
MMREIPNFVLRPRLPDVEIRRGILTAKRDEYLTIAFNADAEIEGLIVQDPSSAGEDPWKGEQAKQDTLSHLRAMAENCRKSAAKMQEMIDALPNAPLPPTSSFAP